MTIAMLLGHNQKNVQGATWLTDSQFISVNGDWFFISIDFTVDGNNNIELMDIIIDFPDGYRSYISLMMPIELFRLTFDFFISSQGEQAVIIHGQNLNPFTPIFASFRHDFLGNRAPVGRFEISQDFDLRRSFVFNQNIIENLNDRIVILNQINQNLNDAYWELRIEMDGILSNLDEIAGYWFHRYSQLRLEINELNFQIQGHLHHIWYLQREIDTLLRNSIRDMEQIEFLTNEMHHYKNAFEGTFGVIENLSIQLTYTQNQLRIALDQLDGLNSGYSLNMFIPNIIGAIGNFTILLMSFNFLGIMIGDFWALIAFATGAIFIIRIVFGS